MTAMIHRVETPGGMGYGWGDTPLQSQESWSGRANYRNSSGEISGDMRKIQPNYVLTAR